MWACLYTCVDIYIHTGVIGDNCSIDADCADAFPNSLCVNTHCACATGYKNSLDMGSCEKSKFRIIRIHFLDILIKCFSYVITY